MTKAEKECAAVDNAVAQARMIATNFSKKWKWSAYCDKLNVTLFCELTNGAS